MAARVTLLVIFVLMSVSSGALALMTVEVEPRILRALLAVIGAIGAVWAAVTLHRLRRQQRARGESDSRATPPD